MSRPVSFSRLPERYAIARFPADAALPASFLDTPGFVSITRSREELSIVCADSAVPETARSERGWTALKLHGPFALDEVGILSSCLAPLAEAGVSVFTVSTFDTDYVLVKAAQADTAVAALRQAGHIFHDDPAR